jgi:hypothetical protein
MFRPCWSGWRAATQAHREDRAFARLARHGHVAARHARELAGEGKAELCAAIAARGQRISLGEILKELGLLFGGQADADPRGSPSCAMQTTAPQDGRAA